MEALDLGQALDLMARVLAVLGSATGIIVAVEQWTRPALLKRRQKWLRETADAETNDGRKVTLVSLLDETSAKLVAGVMVPGWRFLTLAAFMLLGPAQAYLWAQSDPSPWGIFAAVIVSLAISATPIRCGVRLLAERYRVAHEYMEATEAVRPARLGILNQMEGGTRREFTYGYLASFAVNLTAVGVALALLNEAALGYILAALGLLGSIGTVYLINRYARSRVATYGPWSIDNPSM